MTGRSRRTGFASKIGLAKKPVGKRPVALTIAGSDPSGGAGFQADLKTFAALKVYGFSVITAVIAQNSAKVARVAPVEAAMVTAQLEALASERRPDALKTGALADAAVVCAVAEAIRALKMPAPVVDPVLISSSGARLLDAEGEEALRTLIFPLARVVTPNIPEAEALSGITIDGPEAKRAAARALRRMGARAVVIKGGHPYTGVSADRAGRRGHRGGDARAVDLLFDGRNFVELAGERIPGGGAHGTGCAFSAAIAAYLARGAELEAAVRVAKRFVARALRHAFALGEGRTMLDHFAR
jgi:hydroxymethylpyrimidine/phosphomethylpyrimidine kinase